MTSPHLRASGHCYYCYSIVNCNFGFAALHATGGTLYHISALVCLFRPLIKEKSCDTKLFISTRRSKILSANLYFRLLRLSHPRFCKQKCYVFLVTTHRDTHAHTRTRARAPHPPPPPHNINIPHILYKSVSSECEPYWGLQIKWRRSSSIFVLRLQGFFLFLRETFCKTSKSVPPLCGASSSSNSSLSLWILSFWASCPRLKLE